MLKESIRMSWSNICSNRLRSFLTTLGIIIGVTAIIALVTTMEGATDEITSQFAELGAGRVSVSIMGTPLKQGLSENDVDTIGKIDNITGVDPSISFSQHVSARQVLMEDVTIEGRSDCYFTSTDDMVSLGRCLMALDMDPHSRVCVIDAQVRNKLFPNMNPVGQDIVVGGMTFRIVGMLNSDSDNDVMSAMNAMSGDGDGKIILPYQAAQRMNRSNNVNSLTLYISDTTKTDETIDQVKAALNTMFNYKDKAYRILNLDSLLETMDTMTDMMTSLMAGIASIALLVGGIGIMNIMTVNVTERTMEIGLRKALGAKPRLIQAQFLIEAIMLSLLGGAIGIILGNAISYLIAQMIGFAFSMSAGAITLAFTFSAGVGVLFGWAPARKASRLNPIDALRSM